MKTTISFSSGLAQASTDLSVQENTLLFCLYNDRNVIFEQLRAPAGNADITCECVYLAFSEML